MDSVDVRGEDPDGKNAGNQSNGLVRAAKQRLLEFFSLKEAALKELRARWGKPITVFRARRDIARLYTLTQSSTPNTSVDDATWQDLDLNDLFDRIDSNITPIGRQYLYRQLRNYESDEDQLRQRFINAKQFQSNQHLREQTQLHLMGLRSSNNSLTTNMLFGELPDGHFPKLIALLLAATSLVCIVVAFINPALFWLPLIPLSVNFVFTIKYEDQIGRHSVSFGSLKKLLKVARRIPTIGSHTNVAQLDYLQSNQLNIRKHYSHFFITGFDSTDSNPITAQLAFFLNLICLFDFLLFMHFIRHLKKHKTQLIEIYEAVASMDSAISVASYLSANENICNPTFSVNHSIQFDEVVHPLLTNAVPNNYHSSQNSALITGSNMAGKSTFIKTIGINLILAQTLWICHAQGAQVPQVPVISSIKHTDSLKHGKSYYFAEIESLLRLIEAAKRKQTHVLLIDEILHGTNTVERVASSAAILDFLSVNNTVLVTSHDVELTQYLSSRYTSYHFQETADLDNMFDYKINNGHCRTRNAIALLETIGFPTSIISTARKNAELFGNSPD